MSNEALENLQTELKTILGRQKMPEKAVVTAGMPYANAPLHIGHFAGTYVPADTYARFMRMLIGDENVLFVCGSDDHGSNSEVAAKKQGISTSEFVAKINDSQKRTLDNYSISMNLFSATSKPENMKYHKEVVSDILRKLHKNKMLSKKTSEQWYDPELSMFLPDRFVYGQCPKCEDQKAYSEECDACGATYLASQLQNPKSTVSDSTPVLKDTDHFYLDMWKVADQLKPWIESKKKSWRKNVFLETYNTVIPSLMFSNKFEDTFKSLKTELPSHKSRYAPGKMIEVQFDNLSGLETAQELFSQNGIKSETNNAWANRSITRDVSWGVPVPTDIESGMDEKTFYVWPESLVAPISFTKLALEKQGKDPNEFKKYWHNPNAKIAQFIGQDNIYFYVLMQGAMWFGSQEEINRMPIEGELQLSDVFANYHLHIDGEKMSKSRGNFILADQYLDEWDYESDQVRYFLSLLSLPEKNSNFDFETFKQRNEFLAGPMNAAIEKTVSACHKKFDGIIPSGNLIGKTEKETKKIFQTYLKMMEKGDFPKILFMIENYTRIINGLFAQFKPHDDRHDEQERKDALFSSFFILKNVMIMLHPFVPSTMEKLRSTLNLNDDVYQISEFGKPINDGHKINPQTSYFPSEQNK
jgi:methionyl-tRNA synthetase